MKPTITQADCAALTQPLTALRRELHRYPEAGWMEYRTTAQILQVLQGHGISVSYGPSIHAPEKRMGLPSAKADAAAFARARSEWADGDVLQAMQGGFTGCIAHLTGARHGPHKVLRVDIDCNEVQESSLPDHRPAAEGFSSCHPGLMHACGHDGHAAMGVGAALLLNARLKDLPGTVDILFQPAEEGLRGAASLAEHSCIRRCDILLGLHIGMGLSGAGRVAASAYGFLSSSKLDAAFHGEAAHAGLCPQEGHNALAAAAAAVTNLLAISRHGDGASRINIGSLHAESGRNVIPPLAEMSLETRGASGEINAYMEASARRVCEAAAQMYGCTCCITPMGGAEGAQCDDSLVRQVTDILSRFPGIREVVPAWDFRAGEDMTTLMSAVQRHGGRADELVLGSELAAPHHSQRFDFDESILPLGAGLLAQLLLALS